jgi:hypothetical protein
VRAIHSERSGSAASVTRTAPRGPPAIADRVRDSSMPAIRPTAAPLVGRTVELTPMTGADVPALEHAIRRPEVFASGFGGGPSGLPADAEAFASFART